METKRQFTDNLILAAKIGIGSSAAIYIAEFFNLEYTASAGTIALLTLMTSKWETVKLALFRLITFEFAILIAGVLFPHIESVWVGYGLFVFCIVILSASLGWKATISVNAVVGLHLITSHDFSTTSILNEMYLVLIGITMAIILNLFHDNYGRKKDLILNMRYTEERLQTILRELIMYLRNQEMSQNVWEDICCLETKLQDFIAEAYVYQDNTFHSHPGYYIDYFEMRMNQTHVLHNLHYEMKKIKNIPKQAHVIADYMTYLVDYVVEINEPVLQMSELNKIFDHMKTEPLPVTREEFESRALLYHILMDIEEFLVFKMRFVHGMTERQVKEYWKNKEAK